MPRGVYDRSKLKKNKTEAAPAAKAPKGKPGRKPGSVSTKGSTSGSPTKVSGNELELFATVRENLNTLNAVAVKFGDIPAVKAEITAHVDLITTLRQKVFGTGEAQSEAKTDNGATTAAPQQYATSVPMPPSPIPSIPATH